MRTSPRHLAQSSTQQNVLKLRVIEDLRIAALGDSCVFGVGDAVSGVAERHLGWSGRVAHDLNVARYINMGKNGARFRDVVRVQLSGAKAMRPHIVLICTGTNDVLRGDFSATEVEDCARRIIDELNSIQAVPVFLGLPDPTKTAVGPRRIKEFLQRRVRLINTITEEVVNSHGGIFISTWNHEMAYDRSMWHVDRMHPSAKGHQEIAELVRERLGLPLRVEHKLPISISASRREQLVWLLTNGTKWFAKRSIDLIPALILLIISDQFGSTSKNFKASATR